MRALQLVVALVATTVVGSGWSVAEDGDPVARALDWLRSQQLPEGCIGKAGEPVCAPDASDWAALAFRAAGVDPATVRVAPGAPSLVAYLKASASSLSNTATSWERRLLAAVASEGQAAARDFGGVDLLAKLITFYDGTQFGFNWALNDDYFALLALEAAGVHSDAPVVQTTREWVMLNQQPNGGWSWGVVEPNNPYMLFAVGADVDDTAAAIQSLALTLSAGPVDQVRTMLAIDRALVFAKSMQSIDGGCFGSYFDVAFSAAFGGLAANADSTSWLITALNALDHDPTGALWTTPTGASLVSFLQSLQQEDGHFLWKSGMESFSPPSTTAWAALALAGGSFVVVP